ncbi:MAG TPA: hypothetical protein VEI06_03805 [Gemmatimonadaceae bacterium]|nr:hypothetical protein [Gemmatimonadaceae bacterium]
MTGRALAIAFCALAAPTALGAQEFRIGGATVAQVVQLPTLIIDSIPVGQTTGSGQYRQTPDGHVAWCQPGFAYCLFNRSGPMQTTSPIWQDLEGSVWGFGEGLRAYAQIRFRVTGGDDTWPMAEQHFSALAAFIEYTRTDWRFRLGRQFAQNGLGYYNYDGLDVAWHPTNWIDGEVYGGWALMDGVNAPYTSSIITDQTNPTAPNDNGWLIGARVRGRWENGSSLTGTFQLVDRTDFRGLYAEQTAINGLFHAGKATITGDLQFDFATDEFNLADVRGQYPITTTTGVFAEVKHYQPFFQLWSIWSVFSPVGYDEGTVGASWNSPHGVFGIQASGGYRSYENTNAGIGLLRTTGWRIGADASWRPAKEWTIKAGYHYDLGPGAAESDGSFQARWDPNEKVYAGVFGTAFQTAYEYQQGYGTVVGGGVAGAVRFTDWGRLAADVGEYRNTYGGNAPESNWNQFRASLRFEFTAGSDPGYAGGSVVR